MPGMPILTSHEHAHETDCFAHFQSDHLVVQQQKAGGYLIQVAGCCTARAGWSAWLQPLPGPVSGLAARLL